MSLTMVIGDSHSKPDVSNERFLWLGRMVMDLRPDTIIDMGDWEDMPSLSSYDLGKRCYEGRRYRLDLQAAWEARAKFNEPLEEFNSARRRRKERQYLPTRYALGGNHFEGRIERATQLTPMLEGTIGTGDGRHQEFGWEYVPFLEPLEVDGITYQHYFTAGQMNKAISGVNPAYAVLQKKHASCIQGHSHLFSFAEAVKPNGDKLMAFHAGCFFEHDENYRGHANHLQNRGILLLYDVKNGYTDHWQWIPMKVIKEKYGQN